MQNKCVLLIVAAVMLMAVSTVSGVTIDTVSVGNTGNTDDSHGDGYGAVGYGYNMGTYEVTAGQYAEFLNAVAASDPYALYNTDMNNDALGCQITRSGPDGSYSYDFSGRPSGSTADWANRPVNFVTWGNTVRFANWLHNGQPTGPQGAGTTEDGAYFVNGAMSSNALMSVTRQGDAQWALPTESEWYKAAYHQNDGDTANYYDYPTSSDSDPGYVNDSTILSTTSNPFFEGVTDPGNYATFDGDGGTYGIGSPYYHTEVGEWENSASPYGTYDQGGNVWEWNEGIIGGMRVFRGGALNGQSFLMEAAFQNGSAPTNSWSSVGFRVTQVPEPGTISLLAIGGLALLRRRRRK